MRAPPAIPTNLAKVQSLHARSAEPSQRSRLWPMPGQHHMERHHSTVPDGESAACNDSVFSSIPGHQSSSVRLSRLSISRLSSSVF
jgi:hypothetical protein